MSIIQYNKLNTLNITAQAIINPPIYMYPIQDRHSREKTENLCLGKVNVCCGHVPPCNLEYKLSYSLCLLSEPDNS